MCLGGVEEVVCERSVINMLLLGTCFFGSASGH